MRAALSDCIHRRRVALTGRPRRPVPDVHDFHLLSLNCWNGRARPDAIAELLAAHHIDVVCLQELGPEQAEAVQSVLPHGKLSPARDFRGMGIATRFPAEVLPIPLRRRSAWATELRPADWPALPHGVQVIDVHLQAPHTWPWRSLPIRRAQLAGLEAWLAAHPFPHRVLAGDFNSTPIWPAYGRLRRGFADAAQAERERPPPTWGPGASAPRLLRIDHVFTAGVDALDWEVLRVPGSDHSAVRTRLRLADERDIERSAP